MRHQTQACNRTGAAGPLAAAAMALALTACGGGGGDGGGGGGSSTCDDFDCQGMLENLANNVMLPTYQSFETEAQELVTEVDAYCDALGSGGEDSARDNAQQAWRDAAAVWQQAEVMQVGPLVVNSRALRDTIYSWPSTYACGVDQEVVAAHKAANDSGTDYDISGRTPDRRGLDALEYALFKEDTGPACSAVVDAFDDEYWNGLDDAERREARCVYAQHAAADLSSQAQTLVNQWDGTEDDFLAELTNPGSSGSRYDSVEEAVNAVSDALFYVEKQTKDIKLAVPLGLKSNDCGGDPCPADVESVWSNTSKENIRNNFVGLQRMYLGNDSGASPALGFDDYLSSAGDDNVSSMMANNIDAAVASVSDDVMPGTLAENLETQEGVGLVDSAHDAAKTVTDQLKNDFLQVLGLSIPDSAAGDGD